MPGGGAAWGGVERVKGGMYVAVEHSRCAVVPPHLSIMTSKPNSSKLLTQCGMASCAAKSATSTTSCTRPHTGPHATPCRASSSRSDSRLHLEPPGRGGPG